MDVNIIRALLVSIVAFIMDTGQFNFLESLHQPVILGPIIGAISDNFELSVIVNDTYQLVQIGSTSIGGAQPPDAIMGAAITAVFVVSMNLGPTAEDVGLAIGLAAPFAILGQYTVTLAFTIMSGSMVKADEAAEGADGKAIAIINFTEMVILGTLFGILVIAGVYDGSKLGVALKNLSFQFSRVMAGLDAAGGVMKFIEFVILMKATMPGETWRFLFAGFAVANIRMGVEPVSSATLLLYTFVGLAIALCDYQIDTEIKDSVGSNAGGASDDI